MPDPPKIELKIECPQRGPKDDWVAEFEGAFTNAVSARDRIILRLREVADECDDIAEVKKNLEISGGVVSVLGIFSFYVIKEIEAIFHAFTFLYPFFSTALTPL